MSQPTATCPNCGAPIQFRWSSAIQTTCEYCKSILVRHDVNLTRVGQVADLPPDISPIQIGTEGIYRNTGFQVVGRIIYSYELGSWNEWHLVFSNGSSGWLSDAQAECFRDPAVVGIVHKHYVPVRVSRSSKVIEQAERLGLPTSHGLYCAVLTSDGRLIAEMGPDEIRSAYVLYIGAGAVLAVCTSANGWPDLSK